MYRNCAVLCLRNLSLALSSAVIQDDFALETLFYVLASVRLDDDLTITPPDSLTRVDIETVARVAFEQLYTKIKIILAIKGSKCPNTQAMNGLSSHPGSVHVQSPDIPVNFVVERVRNRTTMRMRMD